MKRGIGYRGVVGHARHLQNHFVDRRVITLRQIFDRLPRDGVSRGADFRQDIIVSRLIQLVHGGV